MSLVLGADVQSNEVLNVLDKIMSLGGDTTPAMRDIAGFMESQVRLGFKQSQSPYGDKWKPVQRGGSPLIDTRNLLGNISSQYGKDFAEVGTNVEYAAIHQFGGYTGKNKQVHIDARPYLPVEGNDVVLPDYWEEQILGILQKQVEKIVG